MDPELVVSILAIVGVVILVQFLFGVVRAGVNGVATAAGAAASFARTQVKNKFWRDSGRLATLISLTLLVLAYGFFGEEQSYSLGDALLAFGRERLLEVLPIAILTQVVLLCGFWLIYGLLFRVPNKTLLDPFKIIWHSLWWMAFLATGSVGVLLLTGDDPEAALTIFGVAMGVGFAFVLFVPLLMKAQKKAQARAQAQPHGKRGIGPAAWAALLVALPLLFVMFGALFAAVYMGLSDDPTVLGMIGAVAIVVAIGLLIACYRFRAYIGQAEVPPATGYLIDFSLAISALAVALVSQPGAGLMLGGVPVWLVAVAPALLVASAVFGFNLLRLRSTTPRWALCLAIAVIAGLLVGPAKSVLAPALTPVADLVPLPAFIDDL